MSDAIVDIQGMSLTLTGAVPDPVTGQVDDVYNEGALYAIRNVVKNGTDLDNITNQVLRYGNDLKQLNTLLNWANIDWSNETTGLQRSQLLVDLGLISGPSYDGIQTVAYNQANIAYVTTNSSSSGLAPGTLVTYPYRGDVNFPSGGADGSTITGFTGSTPAFCKDGTYNPPLFFVVDSNSKAWVVQDPGLVGTTTKLAYSPEYGGGPTLQDLQSLYQDKRQEWVTNLGQLSQDSQLIMQSTTTNYSQALDTASNILQGKSQAKQGVANNFY
jgi:uncharacterized protein YukE